ncbi:MAG: GNAT family N-acetyltransferase [Erysipelotrichia bacterium]|nr:GNAT family N-acetyltransferase [Candidatus Riflebacteria bacterium]NCB39273.1 GNAT family N-acetyltransferase [Erysipelotrichia bacterium]
MRSALQDKREIVFLPASKDDIDAIIDLYVKVYKGKYTLPEVADPVIIAKKVEDPAYFWTVAKTEGRLIGSVIFAIDPVNKLGKSYAAAVLSEFRGQDVMRTMVKHGIQLLAEKTRTCDVIYATTRTVSFAPQVVLEHLGFVSMGIFPNVRKVESFETHGFEVYLSSRCLEYRRKRPLLIPDMHEFYNIIRDELNLEDAETVLLEAQDPRKMGPTITFDVSKNIEEVSSRFYHYQDKDLMKKVFFPFTDPNMLFSASDGTADIFVNFNELDGNGVIVGYRFSGEDLRNTLMWFCEEASKSGMRYIEMLVSAFKPEMQRLALDAKFLPCAYFTAMRMNDDGAREDYLVFSRSFESLDFMDMHLVDTNRKFLDAFMKCWYDMLVRCQPDFDEEWRIG